MEPVRISADGKGFVLAVSGKPFRLWGVNYDHDESGRLIEDYWHTDWSTVEADFAEIQALGANVVRIHLQLAKFMKSPDEANPDNLKKLGDLIRLAERTGLYLDLTGLGCYHKNDVPAWYDDLDETRRWLVQARFWKAVAAVGAQSPAVFCYDLMNEPIVGGAKSEKDWLAGELAGKHFVQFITLDLGRRERPDVARQWIAQLVAAIRKHDRQRMITVGLVPWSLDRPGLTSGFVPEKVAGELDFVAVHVYPQSGKLDEAIETIKAFAAAGKPVLVEETFPLTCSPGELEQVMDKSSDFTAGWVGFYWGQTAAEARQAKTIAGEITAAWLELFQRKAAR